LSTTLFNIALHGVIKKIDKRGTIFHKLSQILGYVDDVIIISKTIKELQEVFIRIEDEANKMD